MSGNYPFQIKKDFSAPRKHPFDIEKDFYEDAYSDPVNRFKRGFAWEETPSTSLIQLSEAIQLHPNARILDIGTGADGRHAKHFLDQGFSVVGIEISRNAIRHCSKILSSYERFELLEMNMAVPIKHDFGNFDLIIDWSVMDHIRRKFLPRYKANILRLLKQNGYLISSQFATPMPEKFKPFKNKDYCLWRGHYMRSFTIESLANEFPELEIVNFLADCPEGKTHGINMHSVVFRYQKAMQENDELALFSGFCL